MVPESAIELKFSEILMNQQHFFLLLGVISILYLLKYIDPISKVLFSEKWKWLIAIVNLGLSSMGIFLFKLTDVEGWNVKMMIVFIIAMCATAAYEWIIKYIDQFLRKKFGAEANPPTPPTPTP